jgi:hypothetical protein
LPPQTAALLWFDTVRQTLKSLHAATLLIFCFGRYVVMMIDNDAFFKLFDDERLTKSR